MNSLNHAGRSLLQRMLDHSNRAEEMRIRAEGMNEETALLMLSAAKDQDRIAETIRCILLQAPEVAS